jgi:hypothetical protein
MKSKVSMKGFRPFNSTAYGKEYNLSMTLIDQKPSQNKGSINKF